MCIQVQLPFQVVHIRTTEFDLHIGKQLVLRVVDSCKHQLNFAWLAFPVFLTNSCFKFTPDLRVRHNPCMFEQEFSISPSTIGSVKDKALQEGGGQFL